MASGSTCPVKYDSAAGVIIEDAYSRWRGYADEAYAQSGIMANRLFALQNDWAIAAQPVDFKYAPEDIQSGYVDPKVPDWYTTAPIIRAPLPGDVKFKSPTPLSVGDVPTFNVPAPQINYPDVPDEFSGEVPIKNYYLSDPAIPAYVEPDDPVLGQFLDITLPPVPTIPQRAFEATLPSYTDINPPLNTFAWSEDPYSSALLTKVTNQISTMMDGGTGLPDWIWDMIWDRARRNEDRTGMRAIQEAEELWASRGFSIPSGALNMTIVRAREAMQDAANTLNREMVIKEAELEVENLRFSVQQGLALESMMIQEYGARMQRALDAEKYMLEAAVSIYNAQVAFYNAQLAAYQAEAAVFQALIQADLAQVEIYKAQLDGQKIINEINALTVQVYTSEIEAFKARIDAYKSRIDAVNAILEGNKLKIEGFKTEVEAYAELVRAHALEFEAYTAQIEGEKAKVGVYNAQAGVFKTLVDAFSTEVQAETVRIQSDVSIEELNLKTYLAQMENFQATVKAEAERLQSEAASNQALSSRYDSQVKGAMAASDAILKEAELGYRSAEAQATLELKKAEINIEQIQRNAALELERTKFLAEVQSQLAAAALAALTLSAGVTESVRHSASCSPDVYSQG